MKHGVFTVGFRLAFAVALIAVTGCSRDDGESDLDVQKHAAHAKDKPKPKGSYDPREAAKRAAKIRAELPVEEEEDLTDLSAADWAIRDEMQSALDAENRQLVLELTEKVRKTVSHPVVRRDAVRVLGWFGADVLDALLAFAADSDKGTAKDARDLLATAIDGIEEDGSKAAAIVKCMAVVEDADTLDELATQISSLERPLELATILKVVECGNPKAVARAREAYKFLTDSQFVDRATAVKWLCDNALEGEDLSVVTNAPSSTK